MSSQGYGDDLRQISIVMPCFNDFISAKRLIHEISKYCACSDLGPTFYIVNDNPFCLVPKELELVNNFVDSSISVKVSVINLRCNVGQQAAIAIGACYAIDRDANSSQCLVVMDADGEDKASSIPALLKSFNPNYVTVARRGERQVGRKFRFGYKVYQLIFRLLTGKEIDFGNFMLIPMGIAKNVFSHDTSFVHLAASLIRHRVPYRGVQLSRGKRIDGNSRMSFAKLISHGITATTLFYEEIVGRMTYLNISLWFITAASILYLAIKRLYFSAPWGWSTIISLQLLLFSATSSLMILAFASLAALINQRSGGLKISAYDSYIDKVIVMQRNQCDA